MGDTMLARIFALVASCLLSASFAHAQPADIVLTNGRVITLDAKSSVASAIAIRGETITAVGDDASVKALAGPATVAVDLGGRTVIPGLIDSHIHAIRAGLTYTIEVDWSDATTLPAALERIAAAAKRKSDGWILVPGGWHETQFPEGRGPTPAELAQAAPNTRVRSAKDDCCSA